MNRGVIWYVNLDPTVGSEIKKRRPVIIISSDAVGILPLRIIVPLTGWQPHFENVPWMVKVKPDRANHLEKPSAADTFQIRAVSESRFDKMLGMASKEVMEKIVDAVNMVISDI